MIKNQSRTKHLIFWLCLLVVILVYVYQAYYYWHYINDDAYITFRYSRHLAAGQGPYFNVGEHVEGYTNFSLMMLVALVIRCFGAGAAPVMAKLIGVVCAAGSILLTFVLFRNLFQLNAKGSGHNMANAGGLMAAGVVAVSPSFALNSTSGLETTMFSFFLVLALFLGTIEVSRQRWAGCALAFSVVILTRPEGCLLFAVYWLACAAAAVLAVIRKPADKQHESFIRALLRSRLFRLLVYNGLIVTAVFLCHLAFRYYAYDGEWLPNTYYAKRGGFWRIGAWSYISGGVFSPVFGIIGLVVSLVGFCFSRWRLSTGAFAFAAVAVAGSCLPFITGTDWMLGWRLVIPYLPLVAVVVAGGWFCLLAKVPGLRIWMVLLVVGAGLTGLWFRQNEIRKGLHSYMYLRSYGYKTGHTALANWLRTQTKSGDTIALMDIGIVGYVCIDQTILDLTGLTDRFIAKSKGEFLKKIYDPKYILERQPEFIVLTVTAPGRSYDVPAKKTRFHFWTGMEDALVIEKEFQNRYVRKRPRGGNGKNWRSNFANSIGAERVFEHGHPGQYYLLVVFRRNVDQVGRG